MKVGIACAAVVAMVNSTSMTEVILETVIITETTAKTALGVALVAMEATIVVVVNVHTEVVMILDNLARGTADK